jgi:hypothetical protein
MRGRVLMSLSVAGTATVVAVAVLAAPRDVVPPDASTAPASRTTGAVAVLQAWDRRRAAAWARDDAAALRALYLRGSSTRRHDVAMLAAYRARGLRVTTMQRQVLRVRVQTSSPGRLSLAVTDRLVEGRVTGHGRYVVLPRSRLATRRIVLRRAPTGWRVAEVYDAWARPAASTAVTSRSRNS